MKQLAFVFLMCSLAWQTLAEGSLDLGSKNHPPKIVLSTTDTPVLQRARERLADYIKAVTREASQENAPSVIVLGDSSLAKQYAMAAPDPSREESFSIAPVKGQLVILGQTDKGVK